MSLRGRVPSLVIWTFAFAAQAMACAPPAGFTLSEARLGGLTSSGDLALADGLAARLAGVILLPEDAAEAAAVLAGLDGATMVDTAARDRWQRRLVLIARPGNAMHAAEILLERGVAMADPTGLPQDCRLRLLQAERRGRERGAGLWARTATMRLDPTNLDSALARVGRFALVEGRISSVGLTRRAAYLNFGPPGRALSVELPLAAWRSLERQGWTRAGLRGQKVSARGVVLEASPARLLAGSAEAIELEK